MPLLPSVGNHFHESACRGDKLHQTGEELGQVTNGSPDPKQRSWAQVGGFMYHFARAEDQPGRHQAHGTRRKVRSCCRTHRLREEGQIGKTVTGITLPDGTMLHFTGASNPVEVNALDNWLRKKNAHPA